MTLSRIVELIMFEKTPEGRILLNANAPEALRNAVYEAHNGDGPNDWIYEECASAYDADIADDDAIHAHADSRVDIYTKGLYQWAADMCLTDTWAQAESEAEDMGAVNGPMAQQISTIQYCAIRRIASIIHAYRMAEV